MKKVACILVALLTIFLISACANPEPQIKVTGTEDIGGKYNLTLIKTEITVGERTGSMKKIQYVKEGKVIDPDQALPDSMRPGLDWLKQNTPEEAVIMSWWDYGHAIRAYSEREPVVDGPSKDILTTTVSKHLGKAPEDVDCPGCVQHNIIQDIAGLLVSEDPTSAAETMKKYNAGFLYIHADDRIKSSAFYIALSREQGEPTGSTIFEKALEEGSIEGFELAYSDDTAKIYKLVSNSDPSS